MPRRGTISDSRGDHLVALATERAPWWYLRPVSVTYEGADVWAQSGHFAPSWFAAVVNCGSVNVPKVAWSTVGSTGAGDWFRKFSSRWTMWLVDVRVCRVGAILDGLHVVLVNLFELDGLAGLPFSILGSGALVDTVWVFFVCEAGFPGRWT